MTFNWILQLIIGFLALVTAVFVAVNKMRDVRVEKAFALAPNPERCGVHQTKIAVMEQRLERMEQDIEEIKKRLP
jgi:large-conductance mechanosensitive channel